MPDKFHMFDGVLTAEVVAAVQPLQKWLNVYSRKLSVLKMFGVFTSGYIFSSS